MRFGISSTWIGLIIRHYFGLFRHDQIAEWVDGNIKPNPSSLTIKDIQELINIRRKLEYQESENEKKEKRKLIEKELEEYWKERPDR